MVPAIRDASWPLPWLALVAALGCGGRSLPGPAPGGTLARQAEPADGLQMSLVSSIPTGATARHLALTQDGSRLYAVLEGCSEGRPGVLVMDRNPYSPVARIELGEGCAFQIALDPGRDLAYVAVSQASGTTATGGNNRLEILDTRQLARLGAIPLEGNPFGPIGVAVTPDGARVLVTNRGESRVEVIDASNRDLVAQIAVGPTPIGVAISPDGSRAYVANRDDGTLSVLDLQTGTVSATLGTGLRPSDSTASVATSPDGRLTLVTSSSDSRIAVVDTDPRSQTFHRVLRLVETNGTGLLEIAFVEGAGRALVVSGGTGELLMVDVDPGSPGFLGLAQVLRVGEAPDDVVVASGPSGPVAYIADTASAGIAVIDL